MNEEVKPKNFLEEIIEEDLKSAKYQSILTRFPPEPNGYLHIGHAKSICLNFGLADKYRGKTNLRFDDTNPELAKTEFYEILLENLKWLGVTPDKVDYATDFMHQTIFRNSMSLR